MSEEVFAQTNDIESALSDHVREIDTDNYLIFRSGGILYGVNADNVVEIIMDNAVTYLPIVPGYVSGVINLRGQIVPIIDFRVLLGRMSDDNRCIIVLSIEDSQIGILVDGVDQMVEIEKRIILPVPAQKAQKLVVGMCTIPGSSKTMMVLDCALLLHES